MKYCLYCGKEVKNKYCNVSCQNKHQGSKKADKRYGEIKQIEVNCFKCKKSYIVEEREYLFPQKEKYYCSKICSNSRNWNKEDKKVKSDALIGVKRTKQIITKCKNCGKNIEHSITKKRIFCSQSCTTLWYNKNTDRCKIAGLKSSEIQKNNKRSKNEIYFSELCKKEFKKVRTNEQIFNGWDADVIIDDYKVAVLWNGKWHYEKITKKHSVKQVQNRDKIKIHEIKKMKYKPYIIKDMGKYNKIFVENEFEKFKKYCGIN